jgi:hypothetical protein
VDQRTQCVEHLGNGCFSEHNPARLALGRRQGRATARRTLGHDAIQRQAMREGSRDDPGGCLMCGGPRPSTRAWYCTRACQQRSYRLRHLTRTADLSSVRKALQRRKALVAHTIYECGGCGERLLGERRCGDCNLFGRAVGSACARSATPPFSLMTCSERGWSPPRESTAPRESAWTCRSALAELGKPLRGLPHGPRYPSPSTTSRLRRVADWRTKLASAHGGRSQVAAGFRQRTWLSGAHRRKLLAGDTPLARRSWTTMCEGTQVIPPSNYAATQAAVLAEVRSVSPQRDRLWAACLHKARTARFGTAL